MKMGFGWLGYLTASIAEVIARCRCCSSHRIIAHVWWNSDRYRERREREEKKRSEKHG